MTNGSRQITNDLTRLRFNEKRYCLARVLCEKHRIVEHFNRFSSAPPAQSGAVPSSVGFSAINRYAPDIDQFDHND